MYFASFVQSELKRIASRLLEVIMLKNRFLFLLAFFSTLIFKISAQDLIEEGIYKPMYSKEEVNAALEKRLAETQELGEVRSLKYYDRKQKKTIEIEKTTTRFFSRAIKYVLVDDEQLYIEVDRTPFYIIDRIKPELLKDFEWKEYLYVKSEGRIYRNKEFDAFNDDDKRWVLFRKAVGLPEREKTLASEGDRD